MYCNACGCELGSGARYCSACGRAVGQAVPVRAPMERPRAGRKVAGVCLALANNLNVDVTLIRVLWVVFTVLFAIVFGVVAYLVAWILIPEAPVYLTSGAERVIR